MYLLVKYATCVYFTNKLFTSQVAQHSLVLVYAFSYTFLPTRDPSTLLFRPTENNLAPPTLHFLPLTDELGRVRLKHSSGRGSDYINASFIDLNTHTLTQYTHNIHTPVYEHIHMINSGISLPRATNSVEPTLQPNTHCLVQ